MGIGEQFEFEKTGKIEHEPCGYSQFPYFIMDVPTVERLTNHGVIGNLKKLARKRAHIDREGFMVDDCAAGNIDDAYYAGSSDGEILLAREILSELGINYEEKS
jgi:hypothetical protein